VNQDQIRNIEVRLDGALTKRPIYRSNANAALFLGLRFVQRARLVFEREGST
jgi:hypothetical protein